MRKKKNKAETYVERDVSWMYFNHRILQEAQKEEVPLLERLTFLGIYSNNLDEFFQVRVASLNRLLHTDDRRLLAEREKARATIKTINKLNAHYSVEYEQAVNYVFGRLRQEGVHLTDESQLDEEQKEYLRQFFYDRLNGVTNPIWLSHIREFGQLEDNRIYLLVRRTPCEAGRKPGYAVVKVPDRELGRWFTLPQHDGQVNIMYLDDVVRFCLPLIFIGFKESTFEAWSFKFTKDAEMDLTDELDEGTLQKISYGISSRRHGEPVRLIYDKQMPKPVVKRIMCRMNMAKIDTLLASGRYQNHRDLMKFPACGHPELKYAPWPGLLKPEFVAQESVLRQIQRKDLFTHVPYHSFDGYIRLLREAALRPEVKSIKTTLYRLATDSKVVKALISAARNGKKVTAVVELLARFDEESNIKWSKRMKNEGINVVLGVEGLKVHSKLLYIESRKGDIACVGTGNFHEGNARSYTDYIMMTSRREIVAEVAKVFDFIEKPFSQLRFRHLMVSPNSMKMRLLRMLDTEIKHARGGKEAWIKIKINHITDPDMVSRLYKASQAGVKIDILIRGNCSLVPGIKGLSENIRCVGIIDRYLEHSRILIFANGGDPRYYIGSADWMPRNLIRRIEVMAPVTDGQMQQDLLRTVDFGLRDTTHGRLIGQPGIEEMQGGAPFRSQEELYKIYNQEE